MASIGTALARVKQDPLAALGRVLVERVCREQGHEWRDRELDPATTIALFAQQVLHGNCSCNETRRIARATFTGSAYCQARGRLPLAVYRELLRRVCEAAVPRTREAEHLWRGHRTFHVDGSSFSMPDTPELRKAFGQPSGQAEGCGFPTAHLLVLFSAATGLLLDAVASPLHTGDVSEAPGTHRHLSSGDLLVGDDSFGTYVHLALLLRGGLHGLFPVHHARIVDFTPHRPHSAAEDADPVPGRPSSRWVKRLGKDDQLVEWLKPTARPRWMDRAEYAALPESIPVREVRRTVRTPGGGKLTLTVVTTLTDAKRYPPSALMGLRLRRWDVETNIGHLKTTMGMDVLRCQSEAGVRKELAMFCPVYNPSRAGPGARGDAGGVAAAGGAGGGASASPTPWRG